MQAARRHYRVAQKEVEREQGVFVPEKVKPKLMVASALLILGAFLQGFLLGYVLHHND